MKNYNVITTVEEHMKWGFTREEAEKSLRHDIIFNKMQDGLATEEEIKEMYAIIDELGL